MILFICLCVIIYIYVCVCVYIYIWMNLWSFHWWLFLELEISLEQSCIISKIKLFSQLKNKLEEKWRSLGSPSSAPLGIILRVPRGRGVCVLWWGNDPLTFELQLSSQPLPTLSHPHMPSALLYQSAQKRCLKWDYWKRLRRLFPSGACGKEPACQCRRRKNHRFDPWVGKIAWRREWLPTPVFLPGESHEQRSLAGVAKSRTWLRQLSTQHKWDYKWNQEADQEYDITR